MLANPLERHKRLSTDWMGVIMELEGGVIADTVEAHSNAWLKLAHEEGLKPPFQWQLKRAVAMKAEQAISECLCWTRNPQEVRRVQTYHAQAFPRIPRRAAASSASQRGTYVIILSNQYSGRVPVPCFYAKRPSRVTQAPFPPPQ